MAENLRMDDFEFPKEDIFIRIDNILIIYKRPYSVVVNVPDCDIVVSEFELLPSCYVQFWKKGRAHLLLCWRIVKTYLSLPAID